MFQKPKKSQKRLRMAITGASGSGKTYSSLAIASHLGTNIGLIDTERRTSALYCDYFDFQMYPLDNPTPQNYIDADHNRAWNPWSDDATIVGVEMLVNQDSTNFDPSVDWDCVYLPCWRDMVTAYLDSEGEDFEENGDIPDWVKERDVLAFAREHSEDWAALLEKEEDNAHDQAVQFALSEFLDEIEID